MFLLGLASSLQTLKQNIVSIHPANQNDLQEIAHLMNRTFGENPNAEIRFKQWISDPAFSVLIAKCQQKLIAVSAVKFSTELSENIRNSFHPDRLAVFKKQKIGWYLALAVQPEFRQQGIGNELSMQQLQWLKQQDCSFIAGTSWVSGSVDNSSHLYLKYGFEKIDESAIHLNNESKREKYKCTVCAGECQCRSILFAKRI